MGSQPDGSSDSPDRTRRTVVKSLGAGLATLSAIGISESPATDNTADGSDTEQAVEPAVETLCRFESPAITTAETTTMVCEWEITAHSAHGGFYGFETAIQSSSIGAPETVAEPFHPDDDWVYDTQQHGLPIEGLAYRWSARDRWVTPGRYRIEAVVDPYYPGEITTLVGPYGEQFPDWTSSTLSVEW